MNFDFSDDQKFLKGEVRRYLADMCTSETIRSVLDHPERGHAEALASGIVEQGWLAAALPEAYGGAGFGRIELCAIAEELGRACAPLSFGSTIYFFHEALLLAGTEAQKAEWLPKVGTGEAIGCIALSEEAGPLRVETIEAEVRDGRLTGTKLPVVDGTLAQAAVVLAKDERGAPGMFLARLDGPGVSREMLRTFDRSRGAAQIRFADAPVERLGAAGEGMALLSQILDRAAVYLAFEQIGLADRCLEMARDYALGRYAFGRPIAVNQAVKHVLADMYVKNEIARSNAYYGAWALDTDAPELPIAAAAARVAACEAAWFASKENIQVHGGIGSTWEADCHLYYRRAQHLALVAEAPGVWKERLSAAIVRAAA
jgi:alkylation response protein AidB-like acyl-CoA dehydrogenase